jgi:hypothetical protein
MAVPAVFAKGALVSGTGAITPSIPTGTVDGDDFFLVVEDTNEGTRTAPTDWTQLPNSPQTVGSGAVAGSVRLSVFHRRQVGSTAPASPSVADMGNHAAAMILVVRGGASGTPWEATAGGTSAATTSFSAPGVTTTSPNALILHFAATDKDLADTALLTSVANANLSNLAVIHQEAVATGVGGGIFILTGRKVSAGATGTTTATADASEELCYLTIALTGETVSGLPSGVYWNPVDCAANIALTNSYLTATAANDFWLGSVRANQAITGKKFWRIVLGSQDATDTYVRVGAAQETVALTENLETAVNSTTLAWRWDTTNVPIYDDGAGTNSGVTFADGDIVDVAVDADARVIYFGKNGTWVLSHNPAAGTGGVSLNTGAYYPIVQLRTGASITARFQDDGSGLLPSGYSWLDAITGYNITITPAAVPIGGATVNPVKATAYSVTITPAPMPITGAAVAQAFGQTLAITPASVPIAGAAVTPFRSVSYAVTIAQAAVPITGGAVSPFQTVAYATSLSSGALPITGASVSPFKAVDYSPTITPAAVPVAGATLAPFQTVSYSVAISAASVPVTGSAVAPFKTTAYAITVSPAGVPIAGAALTASFGRAITIAAAGVPIVGQPVAPFFSRTEAISASGVPITGVALSPFMGGSYAVGITSSSVPLVGASVEAFQTRFWSVAVTPASVPIVGTTVNPFSSRVYGVSVAAGAIAIAGATVNLQQSAQGGIAITPSSVPVVGLAVSPFKTVSYATTIAAGALPVTGQPFRIAVEVVPASLPIQGAAVSPVFGQVALRRRPTQPRTHATALAPTRRPNVQTAVRHGTSAYYPTRRRAG